VPPTGILNWVLVCNITVIHIDTIYTYIPSLSHTTYHCCYPSAFAFGKYLGPLADLNLALSDTCAPVIIPDMMTSLQFSPGG